MASADGSILIRTKVDTAGIKQGTQSIQNGVGKINASLVKLGATMLAVFSVAKLIQFGKEAISLASDLQEVQNVVDVAFGDMSYKIEQFADTAIENFGLSELSAKTMASTFMAMANGMKQGLDVASDMAVEMTGRLADIMSFYNKSISEVETIGRAVYSGETEPLKAIGVIMTEAQLQTFAWAQGYETLYKNMSAADKLLIRQLYFLDTTNQAMGDFIRTQDSWANQTRILSERWKEFLSLIGGRLIQVLAPVVQVLNNMLSIAINLATAMANIFGWQVEQSNATATTSGYVADTAESESELGAATNATNKALKKQLAYFDDINVLSGDSASGSGSSGAGVGVSTGGGGGLINSDKTVTELTKLETKMLEFLKNAKEFIEPVTDALSNLWENGLSKFGNFSWTAIKDFYEDFLVPFGEWTFGEDSGLTRVINIINDFLMKIDWDSINENLSDFWKAIEPYAEEFGNGLIDFFEDVSSFSADVINSIFGKGGIFEFLVDTLEDGDPAVARMWGEDLGKLALAIAALSAAITVSNAVSKLNTLFTSLTALKGIGAVALVVTVAIIGFDIGKNLGIWIDKYIGSGDTKDYYINFKFTGNDGFFKTVSNDWAVTIAALYRMMTDFENNPVIAGLANVLAGPFLAMFVQIVYWGGIIVDFFDEKVAPWFTEEKWEELGKGIERGLMNAWNDFTNYWENSAISKWWKESVAPWFTLDKWSEIGSNIGLGMADGISQGLEPIKSIVNSMIDMFNGFISGVIGGINAIIGSLNSLKVTVPSWVTKATGFSGFGFDISTLGGFKIPKLAQGGVIPPNSEFMAILGDQKSGTNIEAPLDTIKQALMEVLNGRGNVSAQSGDLVVKVGDTELIRVLLPTLLTEMNRQGYDTTVLGAV